MAVNCFIMMNAILLVVLFTNSIMAGEEVCSWATSGNTFDLSPLRVDDLTSRSYILESAADSGGEEYSYLLNVCGPVTPVDMPRVCNGKMGAVLQYKLGLLNGGCYIAGKFDSSADQTFALLDSKDPAKGISLTYADGDSCEKGVVRSTTLDIYCANTEVTMKSASENSARKCAYHVIMESYYGCPTECGITASGLCNSKGSCTTDKQTGSSYCKCDSGYSGEDCEIGSDGIAADLDNDIISSIPYMYSANTEQGKWKGDLLLLILGMCIAMVCGLCFLFFRSRYRKMHGYSELAQIEVIGAEDRNGKDFTGEDDNIYIHKGIGM